MISSVSVFGSFRVTNIMANAGLIESPYNHFYVLRNIIHVSISLLILWILVKVPYKKYELYAREIFWVSILLLIVVLIMWVTYKWATGWISIPWIPFTIQPTEFLKFAAIIYIARFLKERKHVLQDIKQGFFPFTGILGVILFLVGAQPDFWTILVLIPVCFMMYFFAWANVKHLFLILWLWIFVAVSVYLAGDYDPVTWKNENSLWYITQRIDNFLADNEEAINNKTINYQTEQALIAIGSGGFTWLWFGGSIQKFWYLPEVQWDFIFSVIVEELWFVGALILFSLYMYIGWRGIMIARYSSKDLFAQYSAFGITVWIVMQACINIGVNLNIVPLTWITLPFISYGGSSLLSLCLWLSLLLSISRHMDRESYEKKWKRRNSFSFKKTLWL